jgi:hypothetical protein
MMSSAQVWGWMSFRFMLIWSILPKVLLIICWVKVGGATCCQICVSGSGIDLLILVLDGISNQFTWFGFFLLRFNLECFLRLWYRTSVQKGYDFYCFWKKSLFQSLIVMFFLYFQVQRLLSQAQWAEWENLRENLSCSFCRKVFQSKAILETHIRIHTGERPYKCSYCGKSFTQKAHLTTHSRLHTGVKPFQCHICNKTFSDSSNYRKHQYTQHNFSH